MEKKNFQKNLGADAALSTVVGMAIGGIVFFKPQAVYELTGGAPELGMIAWVIAGVMTITAGLTATEVSAAIPKTGGMMVYIEEIYGKKLGFLTGWMQSVLFFPANIAAISVMFRQQSAILLGNQNLVIPMTVGLILLVGVLNTLGSKTSNSIQTISTICKLVPLSLIIVFGCINDYLLTGPRILYTLGQQKKLPEFFGKLNKHDVPANATIVIAILSALYALSGQFNLLSDLSMFAV